MYDIDLSVEPVYTEKMDGSLIQVVNDPEYGMVVSTKGGFQHIVSTYAKEYIEENFTPEDFEQGLTYAFELIHPENRIVLDYGDTLKMVLLAVIDIETGKELDIYKPRFSKFERVKIVYDTEQYLGSDLVEGVVAKVGQHRYKIKTGEYVRLHRIVTDFTPRRVWESLRDGKSLEFPDMPEEFQQWLDDTISEVQGNYDAVMAQIKSDYERTKDLSAKELGLTPDIPHKGLIYTLRNGQDISPLVWRIVKPKGVA
jgi:RNA ligase